MSIQTRRQRLKQATHSSHERLDRLILQADPFASRAHYAGLLRMHYLFHYQVDPLFDEAALTERLPMLAGRHRLPAIQADLHDLKLAIPTAPTAILPLRPGIGAALGWLYVAEGSRLGAAVLYKMAARLGLDRDFGARHLSGHPEGRARHWREFIDGLDGLTLAADEEQRLIDGAQAAFACVRGHAEKAFAGTGGARSGHEESLHAG